MLFSMQEIATICPPEIPLGSPLWAFKQDLPKLRVIEEGDKYTFSSQYQQNPSPLGGGMFKDAYWK